MNRKIRRLAAVLLLAALALGGCMRDTVGAGPEPSERAKLPEIPSRLGMNEDGIPMLKVYNVSSEEIEEMDVESYIMGVVAGEMKNDWPMEALKAQAILARTFTMKFLDSKTSSYGGADISTDVSEAQAYDAAALNDRVRRAVTDTQGIVMSADGSFPYAWFHAHAGGRTELPSKALDFKEDPPYLSVVESTESEKAPDSVKRWTAEFTDQQVLAACADSGLKLDALNSFELGEKGESGRSIYFLINGEKVSAPTFRLKLDASKLKSTMIDSVTLENGRVSFTGSGFGHGVGMSQWGAYQMAEAGKSAEDIVMHYFTGVELVELW